ncbi:toprim domain-containing protein [Phenylobacterium sp.]|uniref:toprim domain-containing protein n=1 Tax=Phenylobacterium sp. TaxID=1871053 RepID=UPI0025F05D5E|nr:toprim domain-containing protein [Phenylobacterium sp.]MCA6264177.1 toprim domain-containing protein [Phenylobacterium sp.]
MPDLKALALRLGGDTYQGGRAAVVPGPGHSKGDRSLSLRLAEDGRRVLWHSFAGDPADQVRIHLGLEDGELRRETDAERRRREEADRRERERKRAFCSALWRETVPAAGSMVQAYLESRGLRGPIPQAVRFHPRAQLAYPWNLEAGDLRTWPVMVALVQQASGVPCGLHLTALRPDGSGKADLRAPRRMLGDVAGGAVRLAPVNEAGELAVAEGIETALAFRQLTGTPTWAALSAGGLRAFVPPAGLTRLIIAADSDDHGEGLAAARALAERARQRVEVVIMPAPAGTDWADQVQAVAHV